MSTFGNLNSPNFDQVDASNTYGTSVGAIAYDARGNEYEYRQYSSGAATSTAKGQAVGIVTGAATVTRTLSSTDASRFAGFSMAAAKPGEYYWVFRKGDPATVEGGAMTIVTDGSAAANGFIYFQGNGAVSTVAVQIVANTSTPLRTFGGQALSDDSSTSLTDARIFLSVG